MKTFHYIALALTALLLVTSCAIDEMWSDVEPADEQKVLTFKPKFEDFETVTKAIGDGSKVDKLLVQSYAEGQNVPEFAETYDISVGTKIENIKIPFFYSKTYKVYFWAYDSDGEVYQYETDSDGMILLNKEITVNYPTGTLAYNSLENLDAFYSVQSVNLSDSIEEQTSINLTRPFAQVNLGALAEDFATAPVTEAIFTVEGIPTKFTLAAERVTTSESLSDKTFTFTDFTLAEDEGTIQYNNSDYRYVGTTYIFVPFDATSVAVDVTLKSGDKTLKSKSSLQVNIDANKRTNLIFTDIAPKWDDTLADNADDVPKAETDGWIHITKPEELAALLIYGGTEGKNYHICANMDMSGMPSTAVSKIGLASSGYKGITIDAGIYDDHIVTGLPVGGGSYMLKNINNIKAFFGTASDLSIQNVILDNVTVSGNTHIGVLVNSLSGVNTFTNVTIQNSSATTTSGAAGGMIGYAGRSSETDRSEPLSVTVDNCKINSTTVAGNQAEGRFVGLFSGYDNAEALTFTDCSASETSLNDWTSPYTEGNKGAWLADNDYSAYNGWLGDEVYYRGIVTFGGNRFQPKWDGKKSVEPIYEDGSKKVAQIWSAFDLAYLQDKSLTTINFKVNVDLGSNVFVPILSLSNIDGGSKVLHNLKVDTMQLESSSSAGGAFVRGISNGTVKNLTFDGANIIVAYDPNGTSGNAYAGTLASTVYGKTTILGVKCINGRVHAICKMGGLIGRVSDGSLTCNDCHVENYLITNEKAPDYFKETFKETAHVQTTKKIGITFTIDLTATAEASFNSEGEVGGFIGFIAGSADIDDCTVSTTTINAYGQLDDHSGVRAVGTVKYKFIWNRTANLDLVADYTIAGRHVNKFIGDIRPTSGENVTIDNCSADAERTNANCFWNTHTCKAGSFDLVGCAYYIGGKVQMDGIDMGKTFGESKGSVKINGTEVLDEAIANISIEDVLSDLI